MALVKCSECSNSISDQAESCPHCGNPIKKIGEEIFNENPAITIQKTFKKWKALKLVSWILVITGILMLSNGSDGQTFGSVALILGIIGLIVAKFGSWWTTG